MANIILKKIKRFGNFNNSHRSVRERLEIMFVRNHKNSIIIRTFSSILKFISCLLYIVQVIIKDNKVTNDEYSKCSNDNKIVWRNLVFLEYNPIARYFQFSLGMYGLLELAVYFYVHYNGKFFSKILNPYFIIEFGCDILWLIEMTVPSAKNLYVPTFLNCWIIKRNLEYIFKDYNNLNDKHSESIIGQSMISLATFFGSLIMTSACGFEYLERASPNCMFLTLYNSFYHSIITLSTVGYGDITPDYWLSKLFVAFIIVLAITIIPVKVQSLITLWNEKKKSGGSYSSQRSEKKHIVLCLTELEYDFILNFLKEFYSHRRNQGTHTVLFSNAESNQHIKQILHSQLWNGRVYYIHGSALRDSDLERAKVHKAKAVFLLTPRGCVNKDLEDQHTILRSWAIKDFAPKVPQFVQIFRTENKVHLEFVDNLVCEDEFKYAILANNCICPGISTLVTLLMHKAAPKEKYNHLKDWQQLYGKLAGNQIHSICASKSRFFSQFIGKKFPVAAYAVHKRYNITLMGIATQNMGFRKNSCVMLSSESDLTEPSKNEENCSPQNYKIVLNPGANYEIDEDDICIYSSIKKEEKFDWSKVDSSASLEDDINVIENDPIIEGPNLIGIDEKSMAIRAFSFCCANNDNLALMRKASINSEKSNHHVEINDSLITVQMPPNSLFFGCFKTQCKLLRIPNEICCLELNGYCQHKSKEQIQHKWLNKCIIIAAEYACSGLFNFIVPLRGKHRTTFRIKPIVLLLKYKPPIEFLESLCSFPLIYWCQGCISNIDSLLRAGILNCSALVVVSNENRAELEDESLYDSSNLFAIENVSRFFPGVKIVTELKKATNIRFMKYRAKEMEKEKYMKTTYMYKPAFASGSVFSASMMDTLLYQAYSKPYLIKFIKLLLGLKQIEGSGSLTAILITLSDMWIKTYGHLFKKLAYTSGEIPIGIYRTIKGENKDIKNLNGREYEQLIIEKMMKHKIDRNLYEKNALNSSNLSYVLINPPHDFELAVDDIVYVVQPVKVSYPTINKPRIQIIVEEVA